MPEPIPDELGSATASAVGGADDPFLTGNALSPEAGDTPTTEEPPSEPRSRTTSVRVLPGRTTVVILRRERGVSEPLTLQLVRNTTADLSISLLGPDGRKVLERTWPAAISEQEIVLEDAAAGRYLVTLQVLRVEAIVSIRANGSLEPGNPGLEATVAGGGVRFMAIDVPRTGEAKSAVGCHVSWDPELGSSGFLDAYALTSSPPYLVQGEPVAKASVSVKGTFPAPGIGLIVAKAPPGMSQKFSLRCADHAPYLVEHQELHTVLPSGYRPHTAAFAVRGGSHLVVMAFKEPSVGEIQMSLVRSGGALDHQSQWPSASGSTAFRADLLGDANPYRLVFLSRNAQSVEVYLLALGGSVSKVTEAAPGS